MLDPPSDCAHCTCRRLDKLELQVEELLDCYRRYEAVQEQVFQQTRRVAAREQSELISRSGIQRKYNVSRATVQTWVKDPSFPPRIDGRPGKQAAFYVASQVEEWYRLHTQKPRVQASLKVKSRIRRS